MPSTSRKAAQVRSVTPLFLVRDVILAAEFYRDRLGFQILEYFENPPDFVFVRRDKTDVILRKGTPRHARQTNGTAGTWDAYFWVDDIQSLRREFAERGTHILLDSPSTPEGTRELEVVDLDGHRLCFAQDLSGAS